MLLTGWCNEVMSQSSFFASGGGHVLSLTESGSMFQGISSIYTNPAGLSSIENYAFDVGYNQRYSLNELSTVSLAGAKNIGSGVLGVSVARYGYSAFSESKIGLLYSRKLFSNVSIGAGFNMLQYAIDQYGSTSKFTFEVGLQSALTKKLSIGAYVFSPSTIVLTEEQEIPSRFTMGLKYVMSSKADIYFDISKTINRDPEVRFAVDYKLIDSFAFRFGGNITKESIHFGPVFNMNNGLSIVGGYSFDNRLGHSAGLSLTYARS